MAKRYRVCGTYGCTLKDNHCGLHCIPPLKKRRAADFFDNKKHAVIPELLLFECVDERNDILIEDPLEDFLRTGTLSPPPSPHPMKLPPYVDRETAKLSSPRSESSESSQYVRIANQVADALWPCAERAETPPCVITCM